MSTPKKATRRKTTQYVYQLHIQLDYIEPAIWRRIWVPDNLSLAQLDRIIQAAMGWGNMHLHAFQIGDARYGVPNEDWGGTDGLNDDTRFDVAAVLQNGPKQFVYTYDFGDDWRHTVTVESILPVDEKNLLPLCLAGANACPPEDVGGPPGYGEFLHAIVDPTHAEHLTMWRWHGGPFDPAGFDMNSINVILRKLRK